MVWMKRIKELKKAGIRTSQEAANLTKAIAKRLAPKKTGETIRGIKVRKRKKDYIVESWVRPKGRTGFRQNFWTNQTAPHRRPKMYWNKGKQTLYGDGSHRTTGTPRWFHFATLRAREKFPKIAQARTRAALRARI